VAVICTTTGGTEQIQACAGTQPALRFGGQFS